MANNYGPPYGSTESNFGKIISKDLKKYRDENLNSQNDQERIDTWVEQTSLVSGVNLVPFYEDWGFPISENTKNNLTDLPVWTENPMNTFD